MGDDPELYEKISRETLEAMKTKQKGRRYSEVLLICPQCRIKTWVGIKKCDICGSEMVELKNEVIDASCFSANVVAGN